MWPSRNASVHSRGKVQVKTASEYGKVMTNTATVVARPSRTTSAWPKSARASPGGWASGTKTSAVVRLQARTASLTVVRPPA